MAARAQPPGRCRRAIPSRRRGAALLGHPPAAGRGRRDPEAARPVSRVLVIGGGLAGTWAAVTASQAGAEVVLVSRAPGATALYAGGMEIAPDLEEVMANEPFHPFTRLYRDHLQLGADLEQVCAALAAELGRAGLPFAGDARRPGRYADLHGRSRSAHLVPRTAASGELGVLRARHAAVP